MKEIKYIKQPAGYLCGQACVTMLAGVRQGAVRHDGGKIPER